MSHLVGAGSSATVASVHNYQAISPTPKQNNFNSDAAYGKFGPFLALAIWIKLL